MKKDSYYFRFPHYLCTPIIENRVIDEVCVIFQMSRVIKLALMCSTFRIFIFNIKTDTAIVQVAKIFTIIQTADKLDFYRVVHQTSLSKEVVGWKVEFTISS